MQHVLRITIFGISMLPMSLCPKVNSAFGAQHQSLTSSEVFGGVPAPKGNLAPDKFQLASGRKRQPPTQVPLWSQDLRTFGYDNARSRWGEIVQMQPPFGTLCFTNEDTVVASFVKVNSSGGISQSGQSGEATPYRLHGLFMATTNGKLRTAKEWLTSSMSTGITPADGGEIVVIMPGKLSLYSSGLLLLNELELVHGERAKDRYWEVSASTDGRSMVIMFACETERYRYLWVDLENLHVVRSWTEVGSANQWQGAEDLMVRGGHMGAIYDDRMTMQFTMGFLTRELDAPWRLIRSPAPDCRHLAFLNSSLLVCVDSGHEYGLRASSVALVETNGKVMFYQEFPRVAKCFSMSLQPQVARGLL